MTTILFLAALVPPAISAGVVDGILTDVAGDVEIQVRGEKDWVAARSGMRVKPGDQISTGLDGRAVLIIKNSKTEISRLTQFVVGRCVESDAEVYTELFLRVGKVVSEVSKHSAQHNRFNIVTPTAVAGVRGTKESVGYFPGIGTEAKIKDGKGFAAPVDAKTLPPQVQGILGMAPDKAPRMTLAQNEPASVDENKGKEGKDKDEKGKDDEKKKKKKEKGNVEEEGEETDKQKDGLTGEGGAVVPAKDEGGPGGASMQSGGAVSDVPGVGGSDFGGGASAVSELNERAMAQAGPGTTEAAVDAFNSWMDQMDKFLTPDAGIDNLGLIDYKTLEYAVPVDDGLRISISDIANPEAFLTTESTQTQDAQTDAAPAGLSQDERQEVLTTVEAVDRPLSVSVSEDQSTFDDATQDAIITSTSEGGVPPAVSTTRTIVPPALPDRTGHSNINN